MHFSSCVSGPSSVLWTCLMGAQLPAAVLLLSGPGVRWTPSPHHRSLLLPPGEAQTQLPGAATHLPRWCPVQVSGTQEPIRRELLSFTHTLTFIQSDASCSTDYDQSLRGTNQQNQKPKSLIAEKSLRLSGQICAFDNYLEVREASKGGGERNKNYPSPPTLVMTVKVPLSRAVWKNR